MKNETELASGGTLYGECTQSLYGRIRRSGSNVILGNYQIKKRR